MAYDLRLISAPTHHDVKIEQPQCSLRHLLSSPHGGEEETCDFRLRCDGAAAADTRFVF